MKKSPTSQRVVIQYPQARDPRRELGIAYYQQHTAIEEAREQFEALQKIDPDDLAAHYNLAVLYRRMGMKDKAAEQAALFPTKQVDPGAPTYSLEFLRKHPEISTESVPWHMHTDIPPRRPRRSPAEDSSDGPDSPPLHSLVEPLGPGASLRRSGFAWPRNLARARSNEVTTPKQDRAPPGPKSPIEGTPLGLSFVDVVKEAGLAVKTIYGGEGKNKYLLETTGCGLAFYDYDEMAGWIVFLVNGWRLEGFPDGQEPRCHLFKNNRDGTFTDVTKGSGLEHRTGWGQACCVGDYNNDGHDDLFVTYYGQNALYRNQRQRHFHRCDQRGRPHRSPAPKSAGTPAALLWITIATAISISSSPTMSISI